ncbi:MAG: IclR family transcriptional regulator [Spirochaeta sp.]|jgi:DNA-binding IclR family transcriptional regulator|nr:IclR family transcriptional regulator [Spirochaeta sp.]
MILSVIKAIDILQQFSIDRPQMSLADISEATTHPKTTLRTILATLESQGYVVRVNGMYALGSAVIGLSQSAWVNVEIRDRAAPGLRELADAVGESVYLTVPDGNRLLYIYAIESSHRLEARSAIGDHAYYHSTAVGKAFLASISSEQRDHILGETGLPRRTPNTIVERAAFEREMDVTRERGYSIDRSENEPATYCLGAPLRGSGGTIVASCSISGNESEVVDERREELAKHLIAAGDLISKRLGYVPSRVRVQIDR